MVSTPCVSPLVVPRRLSREKLKNTKSSVVGFGGRMSQEVWLVVGWSVALCAQMRLNPVHTSNIVHLGGDVR